MAQSKNQQKIEEFIHFAESKLQPDLEAQSNRRDIIQQKLSNLVELRNAVELMQNKNMKEMDTMLNMGCDFYMQAHVPDTSKVFVNIGLGFHVGFNHDEAIQYIDDQEKILSKEVEELTDSISKLKANISLIYAGIQELRH